MHKEMSELPTKSATLKVRVVIVTLISALLAVAATASAEEEKETSRAQIAAALEGQQLIIAASRSTSAEATSYANELSEIFRNYGLGLEVTVFLSQNNWYAISIGSVAPSECSGIASQLVGAGLVPSDTFCSNPNRFVAAFNVSGATLVPLIGRDFNQIQSEGSSQLAVVASGEDAQLTSSKPSKFIIYGTPARFQEMQLSGGRQAVVLREPQSELSYCTSYIGQTRASDASLEAEMRELFTGAELQIFLQTIGIAGTEENVRVQNRSGCGHGSYKFTETLMAQAACEQEGGVYTPSMCWQPALWNSLSDHERRQVQQQAEWHAQALLWRPDYRYDGEVMIVEDGLPYVMDDFIVLGELDVAKLDKRMASYADAQNNYLAAYRSAGSGESPSFGSINLGWLETIARYRLCKLLGSDRADWSASAYFEGLSTSVLSDFMTQKYAHKLGELRANANNAVVFRSADEFLISYQSQGEATSCGMLIADASDLVSVSAVLSSLGWRAVRIDYNAPVSVHDLENAFAVSNGYANTQQLEFGIEINGNPELVKQLSDYGISNSAMLKELFDEMSTANYDNNGSIFSSLNYLTDRASAETQGISILEARNARERREAADRARRAEQQRAAEDLDIQRLPYMALVSCKFGDQPVPLESCMYDTTLEVTSDGNARIYRAYDLANAGRMTPAGLEIRLTEAFRLRARNGEQNLTLEVTITDRATRQQVFQDVVGSYGSIGVQN